METKTIQISAGKGPIECAYVVSKVLKEFLIVLKNNTINYKILSKENASENGTVQSVCIQITGNNLAAILKNWVGTIQWVGTSTFRKHNKRKNWFIGCFEIDALQELIIKESDIQFQAIRSSGPGGQHVNKVSSAIRAKHIKTGLQVVVMDSRSQHHNKKIAIKRLQEKVNLFNDELAKEQLKNQWDNHQELERGNPIQVFKGTDFKRVKKDKSFKNKRNQLKNDLRKHIE
jgi:peptide chain release factor